MGSQSRAHCSRPQDSRGPTRKIYERKLERTLPHLYRRGIWLLSICARVLQLQKQWKPNSLMLGYKLRREGALFLKSRLQPKEIQFSKVASQLQHWNIHHFSQGPTQKPPELLLWFGQSLLEEGTEKSLLSLQSLWPPHHSPLTQPCLPSPKGNQSPPSVSMMSLRALYGSCHPHPSPPKRTNQEGD